jgi:hypothetical protein
VGGRSGHEVAGSFRPAAFDWPRSGAPARLAKARPKGRQRGRSQRSQRAVSTAREALGEQGAPVRRSPARNRFPQGQSSRALSAMHHRGRSLLLLQMSCNASFWPFSSINYGTPGPSDATGAGRVCTLQQTGSPPGAGGWFGPRHNRPRRSSRCRAPVSGARYRCLAAAAAPASFADLSAQSRSLSP